MQHEERQRRLPIGAEVLAGASGVHFRVWAPARRRVAVVLEGASGRGGGEVELTPERANAGYFSGVIAEARDGTRYRFRLDDDKTLYPDPASRFQPDGPHGPSQVVDPSRFRWTDAGWRGVNATGQVVYEMHVGTFTREGSWAAAARELEALGELGVTVLELMPVADFPGRFGWGYDGVNLFAPTRLYGEPDEFRRFVDRAHALGLGVILDVVYNHLGPDGNYLKCFAPAYFTDRYKNEWGEPINFDGEDARPVREYFVANAGYWIDEYHLDGLRLDATQSLHDDARLTGEHVLAEISRRARAAAGGGRAVYLVAENEPQHARLVRPLAQQGYGLDALWNDDFHHAARVAATGRREAYYQDYLGTPQEFVSTARRGFLYQGQRYAWQKQRRGTSTRGLSPANFVAYLQNHDQVANSLDGRRLHQITSPGRYRALTALLLLGPSTPMLFQGQEYAADAPFLYFADHKPELARLVAAGRREFLSQFPSIATEPARALLSDPADPASFERCRLDHGERTTHRAAYALHQDLLRLRRGDPVLRAPRVDGCDGAVLAPAAFVLRFFAPDGEGDDRALVVNLGPELALVPCPEPLMAPPAGGRWGVLWSSDDVRYGGPGAPAVELNEQGELRIPAECAVLLVGR